MHRLFCLVLIVLSLPTLAAERPNVILIITDDQGYGDVGAHGNTILKTPNLDKLHIESIRLTDYHTDPTCSPTRAALLTGRYSTRTTVWHTINGRSLLPTEELTLAEVFKSNDYRTAMFGKWHLGDNAPLRPMDQGFDHVVWHKGGGVSQGPDYLGNDYFDDIYEVNGVSQQFKGYCTDIWFDQAKQFIEKQDDKPFFIYLSTNAAHGPWIVEEKYSQPYVDKGIPKGAANFYGMIENLDENVGGLRAFLKEQGLDKDTLVIYTSDNGSAVKDSMRRDKVKFDYFNAGLRYTKGSHYDGGHRVPFFMHWPGGEIAGGKDVDTLCAHFDIMPTLVDLLQLDKPEGPQLDGFSLVPVLNGEADAIPERTLFTALQRKYIPPKWVKSVAMTQRWRLIDGEALYDITTDRGQQVDVAAEHPEVVAKLREDYEAWWQDMQPHFELITRIDLGGVENPTTLMSHDWLMKEGISALAQIHVNRNVLFNGPFAVNVVKAGKYRITPMRWPEYVDKPSGCKQVDVVVEGKNVRAKRNWEVDPTKPVEAQVIELPTGPALLTSTLTREDGKTFGAYYVKIEFLNEDQ